MFAKHCTGNLYSRLKGLHCLCGLIEGFRQRKFECNDEDTKDDTNRLQR